VASNEHIRRVIEEIEKMRRQIRNSKLKIKRRIKHLEKTFDPLERQRIELEIGSLKRKILRFENIESKLCISIMGAKFLERGSGIEIDWSKAGKA